VSRKRIIPSLALVAVAGAFALAAQASTNATKLVGATGPSFTITLKKAGKMVKTLPAGKYTITVKDKSAAHSFHLRGPGVNKVITGVAFTGSKTVTVTLKKGRYAYFCDPHELSGMKHSFTVK
jgi:copper binding plastocyanin/azurin family protein